MGLSNVALEFLAAVHMSAIDRSKVTIAEIDERFDIKRDASAPVDALLQNLRYIKLDGAGHVTFTKSGLSALFAEKYGVARADNA